MLDAHNKQQPSKLDGDERDRELLARSNRGDRQAFHELYAKYYHPLLRFIYRITGQLDLAQEAINDVMLVIWQQGHTFAGRSRLATWIMGIAYRKALKLLQKSRRWSDRISHVDIFALPEPSLDNGEPTSGVDLKDLLEQGMKTLSANQRAVVELTYYYGCSYEEIAIIVDCPVNTVKTRMFHARAKLKAVLPGLGRDWDRA
jgi:RNA polymerase sigma-70 factor (ECF subfamily)